MAKETPSLWEFGGIGPIRLGQRVWKEMDQDDIFGKAAQLSYYFLLALFPALLFLVSLLGMAAGPGTELRASLFETLASILPQGSSELVTKTVGEVTEKAGGGKMVFGLLTALWAAAVGLVALIDTLNAAYDVKERRPWWKKRLVALALTVGLSVLIITALGLVLFGERLAEWAAGAMGLGGVGEYVLLMVRWGLVLGAMFSAFATLYYFAPNLKEPKWYWISPGAAVGVALWLLASFGFRIYLQYFNNYSATYGSLGAVIILMLWFYLSGLAVLIGGEVNSEIGHVVAERAERERTLRAA